LIIKITRCPRLRGDISGHGGSGSRAAGGHIDPPSRAGSGDPGIRESVKGVGEEERGEKKKRIKFFQNRENLKQRCLKPGKNNVFDENFLNKRAKTHVARQRARRVRGARGNSVPRAITRGHGPRGAPPWRRHGARARPTARGYPRGRAIGAAGPRGGRATRHSWSARIPPAVRGGCVALQVSAGRVAARPHGVAYPHAVGHGPLGAALGAAPGRNTRLGAYSHGPLVLFIFFLYRSGPRARRKAAGRPRGN